MTASILLDGVGKSFVSREGDRARAVEGISLAVRTGTICCLVGPTGCGKSTILRLAAGLEEPDHGKIAVPVASGGGAGESPVGLLT